MDFHILSITGDDDKLSRWHDVYSACKFRFTLYKLSTSQLTFKRKAVYWTFKELVTTINRIFSWLYQSPPGANPTVGLLISKWRHNVKCFGSCTQAHIFFLRLMTAQVKWAIRNVLQIPWLFHDYSNKSQNSLTFGEIPWFLTDLENIFSLTAGNSVILYTRPVYHWV